VLGSLQAKILSATPLTEVVSIKIVAVCNKYIYTLHTTASLLYTNVTVCMFALWGWVIQGLVVLIAVLDLVLGS